MPLDMCTDQLVILACVHMSHMCTHVCTRQKTMPDPFFRCYLPVFIVKLSLTSLELSMEETLTGQIIPHSQNMRRHRNHDFSILADL